MEVNVCENCKNKFDRSDRMPMTLPCSHPLCRNCISSFIKGDKNKCPKCGLDLNDINFKELKPHQMILSLIQKQQNESQSQYEENSESNDQSSNESRTHNSASHSNEDESNTQSNEIINQTEYCTKHKEKEIEFFCKTCTTAICSICIFETHNGHHLTLLEDTSTIIKNNVKDFGKILKNLEKVNEENHNIVENKLEEVENQKQVQISLVTKSFEEIKKKINSKYNEIIEEFTTKYTHEIKRFKKIETVLESDKTQMERIAQINDELTNSFETFSDAKILKKVEDFTSFLQKSAMDIKRLYKTEISLKAELVIDPAMKPLPINISDLLDLLEKIDPKTLCYPFEDSSQDDTDSSNPKKQKKKIVPETYHQQSIEKKSFDNEIKNYLNRIGTFDSDKTDSDNLTEDFTTKRNLQIPKQRKLFLQKIKNQHDHVAILPQVPKERRKHESASKYYETENNNMHQSIKQTHHHLSNLPHKNIHERNRVTSAENLSKRSGSIKLSLPKIGIEPDIDSAAIYCFGEASYSLKLSLSTLKWEVIKFTDDSKILGAFRYQSLCTLPGQKLIMSGGCKTLNDEASNVAIEINSSNINIIQVLKPMMMKRYGHSSLYYQGYTYMIGGYEHKDQKNTSVLSTLKSCERYNQSTQKWETIANLNHPRAFFGLGLFMSCIFVFGGVYNDQLLSSIEKYDPLTNVWMTYHIKLPEKLAKMGVIHFKKDTVLLLGGINEEYDPIVTVRQAQLDNNNGWFKVPEMICARSPGSSVFLWDSSIIVLGGSIEGICEVFDFSTMKWKIIDSYFSIIKANKMDKTIKNFSCAINFYSIKS